MAVMALVNQLVDLTEHAAGADPETIARWQQMADDCISRSRALGQPVTLAQALEAGGRVKLAANDADAAVALFEEEYQAVCGVGGKLATDQAILAMTSVAKVQLGRQKIKEASEAAGRVIDLIERDRYRVSAPFQQAALLAPHEDVFAIGVFAAWQMAIDGTAPDRSAYDTMLQRMELSKARASVRRLFLTRSSGASVLDEEMTATNNAIHALDPVIEGGMEEDQKERREQAHDSQLRLREQRLQLWDRRAISMRDPDATVPPVTLTGLQEALDPDEAVLYYYWLRPNTLLVVTINADAIAVERRRVEPEQTTSLQKLIGQLGSMKGSNLDLYAKCIEPLASLLTPDEGRALLDGKRRLIVSPHRMLHWYPFAALPYQGAPLVRAFALRYAPNLTSLLVPRSTSGARRMIALAVSEFPGRPDLGELNEVRTEAADATAAYSTAGIPATLVAEPSRAEVLGALRDGTVAGAWCLVVATHGHSLTDEVAKDAPLESVLELADNSVDGYEIAAGNLGCEVVVLTACYAGQRAIRGRGRPEQPGDELFGLGAAFLEARCRNVLAPTWPADDDAMPGIITAFHRNVAQGIPSDLALAQAQREFLDQADDITRNAYYWASLTLTAIGRPVPVPQAHLPHIRPA
jgi:CHAT domain-containing protein